MTRTLREYEHVAYTEHTCSICQHYIRPGDLYRGIVSIVRGRFSVWKEHLHPFCPDEFFEEEEEIMKRAEKQADKKAKAKKESFRRAA